MSRKASVICKHCKKSFDRKPTKLERLYNCPGGNVSAKLLLFLYKNRCNMCDIRFKDLNEATIDHIKPKAKEGVNGIHNYQLLCVACNRRKGAKWGDELNHVVKLPDLPEKSMNS